MSNDISLIFYFCCWYGDFVGGQYLKYFYKYKHALSLVCFWCLTHLNFYLKKITLYCYTIKRAYIKLLFYDLKKLIF